MTSTLSEGVTLGVASTRWILAGNAARRHALFDETGLALPRWIAEGRAHCVQRGAGRVIWQVDPGPDLLTGLFIKHFHPRSWLGRLVPWLRLNRAEREFALGRKLADAGLPTVNPLAWGLTHRAGLPVESYLITEAAPNTQTLFEWIEGHRAVGGPSPHHRRQLAEAMGRLLGTLHNAGIEHRDLHARNILIAMPGQSIQLSFVDLQDLREHTELPWKLAAADLARTGRYLTLRSDRSERLRFLRAYLHQRGGDPADIRALARSLEEQTIRSRALFWRHRDRRASQSSFPTVRHSQPGVVAHLYRGLADERVQPLLDDPAHVFEHHALRWWKDDNNTRVIEAILPAIQPTGTVVYKEFRFKGWHESLGALFRPNQATRAWRGANSLLIRELPTPRPLALIEQRWLGLTVRSFVLTEREPEARPLSEYMNVSVPALRPELQRAAIARLIRKSALLLRALHQRGVSHEDLKAANLLVNPSLRGGTIDEQLSVIDLDGVRTWSTVPRRHRIQNIARLNVSFFEDTRISRTDRLRFLRLYLGSTFYRTQEWKSLWRAAARYGQWKIARNQRRGRAVS